MTKPKKATTPPVEQPRTVPQKKDGGGSVGNTDDSKRGRERDRGAPITDPDTES